MNALNLEENLYLEKLSTCQKHKKQILNVLNNEIEATLFEYLPSCIVRIIKAYTSWESCNSCGSLFPKEFKSRPIQDVLLIYFSEIIPSTASIYQTIHQKHFDP